MMDRGNNCVILDTVGVICRKWGIERLREAYVIDGIPNGVLFSCVFPFDNILGKLKIVEPKYIERI